LVICKWLLDINLQGKKMKINKTILSLATASVLSVSAYGACAAAIDFANKDLTNMKLNSSMNANSNTIINLTDPTLPQDASTKKYVDDSTGGGTQNGKKASNVSGSSFTGDGGDAWINVPATKLPSGQVVPAFQVMKFEARKQTINAVDYAVSNNVDPIWRTDVDWGEAKTHCGNAGAKLISNQQ
jgi:hypothetical protein